MRDCDDARVRMGKRIGIASAVGGVALAAALRGPPERLARTIVRAFNEACCGIDEVAYRPAVVKATMWLPRWWGCDLARLAIWLNDRWQLEYFGDWAPAPRCACCRRRAAWVYVGGYATDPEWADDPPPKDDYVAWNAVDLCSWCRPVVVGRDLRTTAELEEAFAEAREKSIAWSWRVPDYSGQGGSSSARS